MALETMQFDSLFPTFPPKYWQIEKTRNYNSYIEMSVTHIYMHIIKKQLCFTVLPSERDRIKTLETGFRTKRRDQ